MPHSSGGGSHGGGSHSGGHSFGGSSRSYSSGGSSSSSYKEHVRVSHSRFTGANKYVYYTRGGRMHYMYAKKKPDTPDLSTTAVLIAVIGVIAGFLFFTFYNAGLYTPRKLDTSNYESGTMIIDNVGIIREKAALDKEMKELLAVSGVSPAIEIVTESEWNTNYESFEAFAYSEYLRLFNDEKHWLVVLSLPDDYKTVDFVDWRWEGMIGDDCYPAINSSSEELFTTTVQRYLLRSEVNYMEQGLANAYKEFANVCMERQIDRINLIMAAIVLAIFVILTWIAIADYIRQRKCSKAHVVTKRSKEHNCDYCGRLYLLGTVLACPGCGAPVPAMNNIEEG